MTGEEMLDALESMMGVVRILEPDAKESDFDEDGIAEEYLEYGTWYCLNRLSICQITHYTQNLTAFMVHTIYDSNDANVFIRKVGRYEMYKLRTDIGDSKWPVDDSKTISFDASVFSKYRSELTKLSESLRRK